MKNLFLVIVVSFFSASSALSHGIGGHLYRTDDDRKLSRFQQGSDGGKSFTQPAVEDGNRWWGASLSTGWTSREMHYGVDETGNYGAYTTEVAFRLQNLTLSVWSGFGTGNNYQEWDFAVAYTFDLGQVFFVPGYNFRYQPGIVEHEHSESTEGNHEHPETAKHDEHSEAHAHDEHSHTAAEHSHQTYGNELFFLLGTKAISYVTPSMLFVCDLNNTPGSYLEIRLDGAIPFHRDVFKLQPYALLGLNLGYNTSSYYGWNHFQFGLKAIWKINSVISIFGGINYSVAMTALKDIDQGNEVWANAGITLTY
jgi:hypothetical protein